jgi:hypothetical protein
LARRARGFSFLTLLPDLNFYELIFSDHALPAVELTLYAVLENARRFGQQANDLNAFPATRSSRLNSIRYKANHLSDRKLMCWHPSDPQSSTGGRAAINALRQALELSSHFFQMLLHCRRRSFAGQFAHPNRVAAIIVRRHWRIDLQILHSDASQQI